MAGVAVNAVVHISTDLRVSEVGGIVVPMAGRALEHCVVVRIGVAYRANAAGGVAPMINGEGGWVSERRARPGRSVMASRARRGDKPGAGNQGRSDVIGNRSTQSLRAVPIRSVATVTSRGRHGGTGMAQGAGGVDVRAGQRESGGAVIKGRAQPIGHVMATRSEERRVGKEC